MMSFLFKYNDEKTPAMNYLSSLTILLINVKISVDLSRRNYYGKDGNKRV